MKYLGLIATLLVVVGGLNWGLVGLLNLNLVESLLGAGTALTKTVYVVVGLSALYVGWQALSKGVK